VSFCKAQKVIGPSVVTWGGLVGYGFDPKQETYVWSTWVNVELDRRKEITPLVGLGLITWSGPGITYGTYIPQGQIGVVTKNGFVAYYGATFDGKQHSTGLGFYTGYQQFRIEYSGHLKTISFGCGYILK
jgi:hypothetical protein